jgi:Kef-type K+ transport system membrane component KefB
MDLASILTDILVVLIAAKLAAEISERVGIPAVVGEIVAGVLIGPSVLGLVGGDEVLRTLGEIGVILLLLEVGMEMDLVELGKVGRSSLSVATVGVVTPMVLGIGAMWFLIGDDFNTSLFVGAALTATSVGITARVFGDLRALATTEARVVLGAAVADDVMGLVVLTVVVRLVTEGSVSLLSVLGIVAVAIGFLVISGAIGLRISGPLFDLVERVSRSTGTLVAIALAFTLAFATLADAAKLAPIVGAFVAGIALSRVKQADRIRGELAPVGHLFIPVFFLQIGIDADIGSFASAGVLRDAAILLVVAIVGKLVASAGALGSPGDKILIGLGMLPRGEVGLIFATIGLQNGVLGDDLYAALLLVVLVTTLITPPMLKWRYTKLRAGTTRAAPPADTEAPVGGWLAVADGEITLTATPPDQQGTLIGLRAAVLAGRTQPSDELLAWLVDLPDEEAGAWDAATYEALLDVIERGNARSWRFLLSTGVLDRSLPELASALRDRESEPFAIDALGPYRMPSLERLRALDVDDPIAQECRLLGDLDSVLLALLIIEATESSTAPGRIADATTQRLGLDAAVRVRVRGLVDDGGQMLWAAALRPGGMTEGAVLPLASHLDTPERAREMYVITVLRHLDRERWERERLRELHELIRGVLTEPGPGGVDARDLVKRRRQRARALADAPALDERIEAAPASFVLRQDADTLARVVALVEPLPKQREARVAVVSGDGDGTWQVDVGARDRHGLLAMVSGALTRAGYNVRRAVVATWPDGAAVESFEVRGDPRPEPRALEAAIVDAFEQSLTAEPDPRAVVTFDDQSSPWHTICEVEALDRPGLLHELATAFAAAGAQVVAASATSSSGAAEVVDTFELVSRNGGKLTDPERAAIVDAVDAGAVLSRRRFRGVTSERRKRAVASG